TSLRARKRRALNALATEKYLYRCSTRRIGSSVADPATLTSRPRGANDRQRWRWRTPAAALGSWCDIEPAPRRSEDGIDNLQADATCRAATRRYPSTAGAGRATAETSSSSRAYKDDVGFRTVLWPRQPRPICQRREYRFDWKTRSSATGRA